MNKLKLSFLGVFLQFYLILNLTGQTVSGTVISEMHQPLAGVSIWIPNTNIGTVTDYKGNYSITIYSNYNTLRFSFVGFECQEFVIKKDTIINTTLKARPIELNEIFIIGLNLPRKKIKMERYIVEEKKRLFRKPRTTYGFRRDTLYDHLENERIQNIADSINNYVVPQYKDTLNFLENPSSVEKKFRKYVIDSIEYPEVCSAIGIRGTVFARFTINEESKISNVKIIRGVSPPIDNLVIYILEQMPNQIQMEFRKYDKYYNRQVYQEYNVKIRFDLIEMQ